MGIMVATYYFYLKKCTLYLGNGNTRNMYVLNNGNLIVVDSVKGLAIIFTSVSWHMNVVKIVKKTNKRSYAILHAFCNHDINLYMHAFNGY